MSALPIAEAWDDLDDFMSAVDLPEIADDSDVNAELADRMIRRIMRERRLLAADEALVQAEKDRLDAWLEARRAAHDTSFLEHQLRNYHEARLARDPKAKTIHMPSGHLTARKLPDRWEFDEAKFLAWAQGRKADFIRTKVEINKAAAKTGLHVVDGQVIDPLNGEVIDFVTVTPGEVTFAVKAEEADQ